MTSAVKLVLLLVAAVTFSGSATAQQLSATDTIRVSVKLVEVYATVFDSRQHYVSGLKQDSFEVLEDGRPQRIQRFESTENTLSCSVIIDSSGSMEAVMPRVRNSVAKMIDELGPQDSIAIYSFNTRLLVKNSFTTDKAQAKKAVWSIRPEGRTALFDAISLAVKDASAVSGKRAIIIFTDGADNASALNARAAASAAKRVGIPLYTIAEGDATRNSELRTLLVDLSKSTGGSSHEVKHASDIDEIFQRITEDLRNLYMLAYKPSADGGNNSWRTITVSVKDHDGLHVRSKEGYYPN